MRLAWERAAWKIGPFHLQPAILVKDVGYDSNIYYHPEAVSDFWLTAGPAFNLYLMAKRKIIVHLYESPQYVFFWKTKRERTWNNYFNGDISLSFNKILFTFGGNYNNARERWSYEIDIRPRRKEKGMFASLLYQKSSRVSVEGRVRRIDYDYESIDYNGVNIGERLSHREDYLSGRIYYGLNPRIRYFLEGEIGRFDFKNPASSGDSHSQSFYTGFEFSPTGRIRGQIKIGYKKFDTLASDLPDFKGLVGESSVNLILGKLLMLRGAYVRDVNFSIWSRSAYYVGQTWSAGPSIYIFRRKFRLDYTYSRTRNDYPVPEYPGAELRRDDYTLNSVAIYYRIGKTVGLGLSAGIWTREVNVFNWDASRKFLGLNLTYDF
ncbi:MAG: outer membrane beta-barrel protein [Candidatus Aminicenantes bacterium]|nr:outer membrane beta-barrel protein [Candidatus Aminicenantes bacterium]